jgi:hypothetical protein
MKKVLLILVLVLFTVVGLSAYEPGEGFVMGTFGVGYSAIGNQTATSISLDLNVVTKYGLQLSFTEIAHFKIAAFAFHNPAVGIGYSANQLERWTFEGGIMALFDVNDIFIGSKAGVTCWFVPEFGISLLSNYMASVMYDVSVINVRLGISVRTKNFKETPEVQQPRRRPQRRPGRGAS